MLENGEIFNINKNEDNKEENKDIVNFSFGDIKNTGATVDVNSQDVNFDFSFLSSEKNEQKNKNKIKNKELTKESIEILKTFINSENVIISNNSEVSIVKYINSIKDLKNSIFELENKVNLYFKKPYMRKNIKKIKKQNTNTYNDETIKKNKEKNKVENNKNDIKVNNCSE